jgi:tRNA-dihydrouridine synthase C
MNTLNSDRITLAPMEGLADDILRDILTRAGAYDWCVTEFVRVSATAMPASSFHRVCPELRCGARTRAGTPVRVQLLGSDPDLLARSSAVLARLKPAGIDLNFGCPVPLVNRNGGGAALLAEPEQLYRIAVSVRQAVPDAILVSAKMRLGIDDTLRAVECAQAVEAGGVQEVTVHARTKADGYRHPARWACVAPVREALRIPVVANGDIWCAADYQAIRAVTGCSDVMLGRGAVADPLLSRRLRCGEVSVQEGDWEIIAGLLTDFWQQVQRKVLPNQSPGRLKQWLGMLRQTYPQAGSLFIAIRELRRAEAVTPILQRHLPRTTWSETEIEEWAA